jgi:hypothetical protein
MIIKMMQCASKGMGAQYDKIVFGHDDIKHPVTFSQTDFLEKLCRQFPEDSKGFVKPRFCMPCDLDTSLLLLLFLS